MRCHFQGEGCRPLLQMRYTVIYKSIVSDLSLSERDLDKCTAVRWTQFWVWKGGNIEGAVKWKLVEGNGAHAILGFDAELAVQCSRHSQRNNDTALKVRKA